MMYSPHRFVAFNSVIDLDNNNEALTALFNNFVPELELGIWQPHDIPYRTTAFTKYAAIRSIQQYGCKNPIVVWVYYNQQGEISYNISPGKTRWKLWEATKNWKLPVLILDMTCRGESELNKYFKSLTPHLDPITIKSDPPSDYRNVHKFLWIDPNTNEDWVQAEERLQYGEAQEHFWTEYQYLQNTLPQLKLFLAGELVLVWGNADNGQVETNVLLESDIAIAWLNYLKIPINC
jgi:hypothetical protein